MFKIVGLLTNNIYAEGRKCDCFRELQKQYPNRKNVQEGIYPEPLLVVRV